MNSRNFTLWWNSLPVSLPVGVGLLAYIPRASHASDFRGNAPIAASGPPGLMPPQCGPARDRCAASFDCHA